MPPYKRATPLKNYIKKRVENDQDADDILQNVFNLTLGAM